MDRNLVARSVRSLEQQQSVLDLIRGRALSRVGVEVLHRFVGDVAQVLARNLKLA